MPMTAEDLLVETLVVADRCDRCKAQAYTRWTKDDLTLLLCGHDAEQHAPALLDKGWVLEVDVRDRLLNEETT